jgi:hypothetical protein
MTPSTSINPKRDAFIRTKATGVRSFTRTITRLATRAPPKLREPRHVADGIAPLGQRNQVDAGAGIVSKIFSIEPEAWAAPSISSEDPSPGPLSANANP